MGSPLLKMSRLLWKGFVNKVYLEGKNNEYKKIF